ELIVIHLDRFFLCFLRAVNRELEHVAFVQLQRRLYWPRSNCRTLGIEQNSDWPPRLVAEFADLRNNFGDPIARRMAHVQAKDIRAARNQLANRFRFFGSWSEGADDLCLPHSVTASSLRSRNAKQKKAARRRRRAAH